MAVHAHLKNEFTEDKKYHLMGWLKWFKFNFKILYFNTECIAKGAELFYAMYTYRDHHVLTVLTPLLR